MKGLKLSEEGTGGETPAIDAQQKYLRGIHNVNGEVARRRIDRQNGSPARPRGGVTAADGPSRCNGPGGVDVKVAGGDFSGAIGRQLANQHLG